MSSWGHLFQQAATSSPLPAPAAAPMPMTSLAATHTTTTTTTTNTLTQVAQRLSSSATSATSATSETRTTVVSYLPQTTSLVDATNMKIRALLGDDSMTGTNSIAVKPEATTSLPRNESSIMGVAVTSTLAAIVSDQEPRGSGVPTQKDAVSPDVMESNSVEPVAPPRRLKWVPAAAHKEDEGGPIVSLKPRITALMNDSPVNSPMSPLTALLTEKTGGPSKSEPLLHSLPAHVRAPKDDERDTVMSTNNVQTPAIDLSLVPDTPLSPLSPLSASLKEEKLWTGHIGMVEEDTLQLSANAGSISPITERRVTEDTTADDDGASVPSDIHALGPKTWQKSNSDASDPGLVQHDPTQAQTSMSSSAAVPSGHAPGSTPSKGRRTHTRIDVPSNETKRFDDHKLLPRFVPFCVLDAAMPVPPIGPAQTPTPLVVTYHDAALLQVDISGFTKLTTRSYLEADNELGFRLVGIEREVALLNEYFSILVGIVMRYGGDVVRYAGDALIVLFDNKQHTRDEIDSGMQSHDAEFSSAPHRAAAAAVALHLEGNAFKVDTQNTLTIHCALAVGDLFGLHLPCDTSKSDSSKLREWEFVLAGEPFMHLGPALAMAPPGCTVVAENSWQSIVDLGLKHEVIGQPGSEWRGILIQEDAIPRVCIARRPPVALTEAQVVQISCYLPHQVQRLLTSAQFTPSPTVGPDTDLSWLSENRTGAVLFINLHGLLLRQDHVSADIAANVLQQLNSFIVRFGGFRRQFVVDDKGSVLIVTFSGSERDALKALRCAVDFDNTLSDLGVRHTIGISFGAMFFAPIGPWFRQEFTVVSPCINVAARLSGIKGHGMLLMCDSIRKELASTVVTELCCEVPFKGSAAMTQVFRPVKISGSTSLESAFSTPLIGRDIVLASVSQDILTMRHLAFVVTSRPGFGKTHFVSTLRRQCIAKGRRVVASIAVHVERSTPYYAVRQSFEELLEISHLDRNSKMYHLTDKFQTLVDGSFQADLPLFRHYVLGLISAAPSTPEGADQSMQSLLLHLLDKASRDSPLLMIVEDLQHCDEASAKLLSAIVAVDSPLRGRVQVLCTYREADEQAGTPNALDHAAPRAVSLGPLDPVDARLLASNLLHGKTIPVAHDSPNESHFNVKAAERLSDRDMELVDSCSGDPLLIVETCRGIVQSRKDHSNGVGSNNGNSRERRLSTTLRHQSETLHQPSSLAKVVNQQLNRFDIHTQFLLKIAAMLGCSFSMRILLIVAKMLVSQGIGGPKAAQSVPQQQTVYSMAPLVTALDSDNATWSHDLVRAIVAEATPVLLRATIHSAAVRAYAHECNHPVPDLWDATAPSVFELTQGRIKRLASGNIDVTILGRLASHATDSVLLHALSHRKDGVGAGEGTPPGSSPPSGQALTSPEHALIYLDEILKMQLAMGSNVDALRTADSMYEIACLLPEGQRKRAVEFDVLSLRAVCMRKRGGGFLDKATARACADLVQFSEKLEVETLLTKDRHVTLFALWAGLCGASQYEESCRLLPVQVNLSAAAKDPFYQFFGLASTARCKYQAGKLGVALARMTEALTIAKTHHERIHDAWPQMGEDHTSSLVGNLIFACMAMADVRAATKLREEWGFVFDLEPRFASIGGEVCSHVLFLSGNYIPSIRMLGLPPAAELFKLAPQFQMIWGSVFLPLKVQGVTELDLEDCFQESDHLAATMPAMSITALLVAAYMLAGGDAPSAWGNNKPSTKVMRDFLTRYDAMLVDPYFAQTGQGVPVLGVAAAVIRARLLKQGNAIAGDTDANIKKDVVANFDGCALPRWLERLQALDFIVSNIEVRRIFDDDLRLLMELQALEGVIVADEGDLAGVAYYEAIETVRLRL